MACRLGEGSWEGDFEVVLKFELKVNRQARETWGLYQRGRYRGMRACGILGKQNRNTQLGVSLVIRSFRNCNLFLSVFQKHFWKFMEAIKLTEIENNRALGSR